MATCLHMEVSPNLARLITADVRPGRGRLVPVHAALTGEVDGVDSGTESPPARPRTSLPGFVVDIKHHGSGR